MKGVSKAVMVGNLLRRHTRPHIQREQVPREFWLIVAVLKQAVADALARDGETGLSEEARTFLDGDAAVYVACLGISPVWFRRVLVDAGVIADA